MRLLPREEKFYGFFLVQVRIITEASRLLLDAVRLGNSRLSAAAEEIAELERKGDEVIHEVFTRLNQTFITPLDPEDIHALSSSLDDVLDNIEDVSHRIVSYQIEPIPPTVIRLCELVQSCAQSIEAAFHALNKNQKLLEHCIEINRLEDEADKLGRKAVAEIFRTERDPISLIKLKEIYELLEDTTDRCEDVADVLQGVVVKNG